ncbi:MAG: D-glycerate dehydrogenase [Melioribacteraceae bacterium]|nr:D-glycerate dehydrogenase [Melioribacteraceae bacterium]
MTRRIPEVAINLLKKNKFEILQPISDKPISKNRLKLLAEQADGILSLLTDRIDKELINSLQRCKVIANFAVGYNNIDIIAASEKGIIVTNTPGVLTDSTADLTIALMLNTTRRISESEKFLRDGKFTGWKPDLLLGRELKNKILGIIGAGAIGQAVGERALSFGLKIIYYNRSPKREFERKTRSKKVSLNTLLKTSDIISIHLPLSDETKNLLSKEKLELLKRDAVIINTSRGEILDEQHMIKMLESNRIYSAGLDVFHNEPDINPRLLKMRNVIVLPHVGSATVETRNAMAELAAKNIINVLKGRKPLTPVNHE